MIDKALLGMCDELTAIGIEFDGYEVRKIEKPHNSMKGCSNYGVLREYDGTVLSAKRLAEVLEIAEKWDIYLILVPGVRELRRYWQSEGNGEPLRAGDVSACFIQAAVFQTVLDVGPLVYGELTRHYFHFQEDGEVLALETALKEYMAEIAAFRMNAYDYKFLESSSKRLRDFQSSEYILRRRMDGTRGHGPLFSFLGAVNHYMGDATHYGYSQSLTWANHCIGLIRRK